MRVLVTGGAGFIGSHFARKCLREGHEVIVLDDLSAGYLDNIPEGAEFLNLDISDSHFIQHLDRIEADAIVHLAAQASGEISYERPVYDLQTNTLGTLLLLKWAHENEIKKFLYTSSMTVYGDAHQRALKETDAFNPKSFYSVGKIASEHYINIFSELGLNTTVLRLFNIYGPGQNMRNMKQGMISIYMAYIAQNQPIFVKGPLNRYRDFVYIDDAITALYLGLTRNESQGKTFNVCTGRKTTVSELLDIIVGAFDKTPGTYPVQQGDPTPRDQFGAYGDNSLIRRTFDWCPAYPLENGVAEMSAWVRSYYKNG
jgi:UDP-glucose 4-epimerase